MNNRIKVLSRLSNILSVVLHPVFIPLYGLLIIFNAPTFMVHLPASLKRVIFMLAAINMVVVPLALMPFLKHRKMISSYTMESRQERLFPLSLGVMMYTVSTVIFFSYQIPQLIKSFILAAAITSFVVLLLTFRWKVSVHASGIGALWASVLVLSIKMMANLTAIWIPLIILSGVLLSARLLLGSHSPSQVYGGFLTGFLIVFSVMMIV